MKVPYCPYPSDPAFLTYLYRDKPIIIPYDPYAGFSGQDKPGTEQENPSKLEKSVHRTVQEKPGTIEGSLSKQEKSDPLELANADM